ncbi:MAG: phytanoyl-CoA dioxygenase family protein [Actinomycetia bacterium]|nr:phytanoyl-CoA dioxygenase family protein [Actinomycetes bacterium]
MAPMASTAIFGSSRHRSVPTANVSPPSWFSQTGTMSWRARSSLGAVEQRGATIRPALGRGFAVEPFLFIKPLYGHPLLLTFAEAINGPDFVPFNDAIFVKKPGLGGSVSWHQDGVTHWDHPEWDEGIHGFSFQVQLCARTPANGLWAVPGSHKVGNTDIPAVAVDAPRQHYRDETSLRYEPSAGLEDDFRLDDERFERVIKDYNLKDLSI